MNEVVTAISILVALATWLVTHLRSLKSDKVRMTGEMINAICTNPILDESMRKISNMARNGEELVDDDVTEELDKDLRRTLNYYELLAENCEIGILDQVALRRFQGIPMLLAFNVARGYITARREKLKYGTLYLALEHFVASIDDERARISSGVSEV